MPLMKWKVVIQCNYDAQNWQEVIIEAKNYRKATNMAQQKLAKKGFKPTSIVSAVIIDEDTTNKEETK